jgi:RNA polymerase sigma-70 factor (ECF subfamily)
VGSGFSRIPQAAGRRAQYATIRAVPSAPPSLADTQAALVRRLYERAEASRWALPERDLAEALDRSVAHRFSGSPPSGAELRAYLESLHLQDLALACACARGEGRAWDHFVLEFRPVLYRAAGALGDDARESADGLYAELYGLEEREGTRRSLFRYYHGRSALAAWLRAVLAQRLIDRARSQKRLVPLPESEPAQQSTALPADPDRPRFLGVLVPALRTALDGLAARDRLRLALYYAKGLTLAQAGRMLGESEATVSRKLDRTRREVRRAVERQLLARHLTPEQVARCFEYATSDWGFDVERALSRAGPADDA